jgi:hypothetical protein
VSSLAAQPPEMPEPTTIASNVLDIDGLLSVNNDQLVFIRFILRLMLYNLKIFCLKPEYFLSEQLSASINIMDIFE